MKIQIVALGVAAVLLAGVACGPVDSSADPNLTPPTGAPPSGKARSKKAQNDGLLDVKYSVTGHAARGMITYTTPSGMEQTTRNLPWQTTVRFKKRGGEFLSISVQSQSTSGDVLCLIYVNGKPMRRARSTGAYTIASCHYSLPF